jgi:hypothetical protein
MPARLIRGITLAVAFSAALSLPVAGSNSSLAWHAAPRLALAMPGASVFSGVWGWLQAFWPLNGCSIDRSGHCTDGAQGQRVRPQNGCSADPDGQKCVGRASTGSRH